MPPKQPSNTPDRARPRPAPSGAKDKPGGSAGSTGPGQKSPPPQNAQQSSKGESSKHQNSAPKGGQKSAGKGNNTPTKSPNSGKAQPSPSPASPAPASPSLASPSPASPAPSKTVSTTTTTTTTTTSLSKPSSSSSPPTATSPPPSRSQPPPADDDRPYPLNVEADGKDEVDDGDEPEDVLPPPPNLERQESYAEQMARMGVSETDAEQMQKDLQELQDVMHGMSDDSKTAPLDLEQCDELQEQELAMLESIFGGDFERRSADEKGFWVKIKIRSLTCKDPNFFVLLSFKLWKHYPFVPPAFDISSFQVLKSDEVEELQEMLLNDSDGKIGAAMVYDLAMRAQDYVCEKANVAGKDLSTNLAQPITNEELEVARRRAARRKDVTPGVMTYAEFKSYHRMTQIASVIENLSKSMTVVRVEDVQNLSKKRAFDQLCRLREPKWAFHGTSLENLDSVVSRGLLVPGSSGINVANGSAFGIGIYLAKDAGMSLGYCRGQTNAGCNRLLVCRVVVDGWVKQYDWGYVATKSDRVMPCFAIDVRYNPGEALHTISDPLVAMGPRPDKESLTAYASRHLPYGYGHANGAAFQVLEIAPHSDDDDTTTYEEAKLMEVVSEDKTNYQDARFVRVGDYSDEHENEGDEETVSEKAHSSANQYRKKPRKKGK